MGQSIDGVIPISFRFKRGRWSSDQEENKKEFQKYATDDIFDFYNETQVTVPKGEGDATETIYTIKPEILLSNFKGFFLEFHGLIRNDWMLKEDKISEKFNDDYDKAVASGNIEDFLKQFDDDTEDEPWCFYGVNVMYTDIVGKCLLVYHGSRNSYLDNWSTLKHMELLLRAAMRNPLAKVVRFGMSM
jgi:hypothetical protein